MGCVCVCVCLLSRFPHLHPYCAWTVRVSVHASNLALLYVRVVHGKRRIGRSSVREVNDESERACYVYSFVKKKIKKNMSRQSEELHSVPMARRKE